MIPRGYRSKTLSHILYGAEVLIHWHYQATLTHKYKTWVVARRLRSKNTSKRNLHVIQRECQLTWNTTSNLSTSRVMSISMSHPPALRWIITLIVQLQLPLKGILCHLFWHTHSEWHQVMTFMHTWLTATYDQDEFCFISILFSSLCGWYRSRPIVDNISVLYDSYILSVVHNYSTASKKQLD